MSSTGRESAIIIRIPIPPALERVRRAHLGVTARGIPAHVTVLYPFLAPERLDATVRAQLVESAAAVEPFTVAFPSVERFPGVVYLAPEPAAPFTALTERVVSRWPDHPPYGGEFDVVTPHLTLIEAAAADATSTAALARWLPFEHPVRALEVISADDHGHWRCRWRIPLGSPDLRR